MKRLLKKLGVRRLHHYERHRFLYELKIGLVLGILTAVVVGWIMWRHRNW